MQPSATIIIADDYPLFRGALKQALSVDDGDFAGARKAATEHPDCDLTILALRCPAPADCRR